MESAELVEKQRLIVLLPESLAGSMNLAHHIYWLASREQCNVLYLILMEDEANRLSIMRRMATMAAATTGEPPRVFSRLVPREDWLSVLKTTIQPGDVVVCQAEQNVASGLLKTRSMQEYLEEDLQISCRVLSGFYHPGRELTRQWVLGFIFWVGCLLILAGFTLLEIKIDEVVQGFARIGLLFVVICFEFGSLLAWNRIPKI